MKHMVIKGNVKGGHTIKDLGLTVAFGEEALIPVQRAGYSRDLSHALSSRSVLRVGERVLGNAPIPPPARVKPAQVVSKAPKRPSPPPPPSPEQQERDELREMNRKLMETINSLTESQSKLLDKLSEAMTAGAGLPVQTVVVQAPSPTAPEKRVATPRVPVVEEDDDWEDEEEPLIFIPSKIRSDKTTVSDNTAVSEETKEASDKMDQAAQALAAMKKGRKKRRSKSQDEA